MAVKLSNIRKEIQRSQMILIISIAVLISAGGIIINVNSSDKALDLNLKNTAELISQLYVSAKDMPSEQLVSYFDEIKQNLSDVDVISIINKNDIRMYHSHHDLIGTCYNGRKPEFFKNSSNLFIEDNIGPSGAQRRAYSAVYDSNGEYLGFIMTIMLKTSIRSLTARTVALVIAVSLFAILLELGISKTLSHKIKQQLLGYEPDTFSSMYKIRENILESINDGIIAVNKNRQIQYINSAAKKMLKCDEDERLGLITQKVFTEKFLEATLEDGQPKYGLQETTEQGTALLIDCIPVKEDDEIGGVIGILHDRTEYTKLMEDLSGTKYLVDSMRANNHDFTNKLHVILGLIQIGQYDKAVSYIENISIIQRETISAVMKAIDNASFAALLIGKIARASECNVKFQLREGTHFHNSDLQLPSEALITIVGNLIDNALDSMNMRNSKASEEDIKELVFGVFSSPNAVLITVDDTGSGISAETAEHIYDLGYSTKGEGRGVGLYHTKQLVESLGGMISFESQVGVGTSFMVSFKKE